jgi:two-component system, NarL family, nitrate/nitrite response regulator NarL
MADLRLMIVADDPLARAGLAALLAGEAGVAVAGQSGSDTDLAAASAAFLPDAVLWDLGWEPAGRVEALSRFVDEGGPPVVALLATPSVAGEVRAAGARGLLARTTNGAQMAAAATATIQGLLVFDADMVAAPAPPTDGDRLVEHLSSRELDVLRGMAEGLSNKQIARQLEISEHTVKFHVNAILGKLGAQSRTEAVVRATRAGLILL